MSHSPSHSYEDKEKNPGTPHALEASPDDAIISRFSFMGPVLSKLFASGVEARGVERVPEDQRETKNMWNNLLMWWSGNTVLTSIPIGMLAQEVFTLTLPHAIATIFCFVALGATVTSFIATLGPQTGLRTMIITRYSSGYFGCTLYSILNILTLLGFSVTAVILGGQTLASVNPGTLPLVASIVIVGIGSLIPCFIGYNMVHHYERYAWIVFFIVMLFLLGLGGHAGFDINAQKEFEDKGKALSSDILSFGGIVFGFVIGWAPVAADYNCRLPANTPAIKIFTLTFFGLFIPITFIETVGALLMTITKSEYTDAFANGGIGGLLGQALSPWKGGGKFILFLLAFSVIANNVISTYSAALSIQALGRPFAKIPRFFWTLVIFVAYTVAGVAGREHFVEILSNFLAIVSYWIAFFIIIVAEEHLIFRRPGGRLGGITWTIGTRLRVFPLASRVSWRDALASPVWYIGPIGVKAGAEFGADLGFELAAVFAGITFPIFRWLEIRYTGR
ncbi:permease for cytosine/purines, uracil, thiamine, allantoin-domain-containing protein [Mycena leptocephala]|nr:permease for cytosine/purines, uracil, thiamine, allantoin-domain-containing protein [Mycena leptocephala]